MLLSASDRNRCCDGNQSNANRKAGPQPKRRWELLAAISWRELSFSKSSRKGWGAVARGVEMSPISGVKLLHANVAEKAGIFYYGARSVGDRSAELACRRLPLSKLPSPCCIHVH